MKPRFAKLVKLVELLFLLLLFGAFINGQSKEPLRGSKKLPNATSISLVRPSVVVGTMNSVKAVKPPATSKINSLKTQITITLQNSVSMKATKTFFNSSMTATPTTLAPPATGPMRREDSNLGVIIGCVLAGIVVLVMVSSLLFYIRGRRAKLPPHFPEIGEPQTYGAPEPCASMQNYAGSYDDLSVVQSAVEEVQATRKKALPAKNVVKGTLSAPARAGSATRFTQRSSGGCTVTPTAVFYNDIAEDDTDITYSKKRLSRNTSTRPGLAKKMISTQGDLIQLDDIILQIGEGCLKQDTEITLIKDDQNYDFKLLLKLGLLDAPPRVVEFLPDGLRFLKPANLRIRFEKPVNDSELFVLHGSYNRDFQRNVWELVTNDIEENSVEGFVDMKIHGFSFYSYIFSRRGRLARLLSHLNRSFSCSAYVLYRRVPSSPTSTIDIAVVICSEFVENEGEMKQVSRLIENGYSKGEEGSLKLVNTSRRLEMSVNLPGVETTGFQFKLDMRLLDSVGYVVDNFMGIAKEKPASGVVEINEVRRSEERKPLWTLRFREVEEEAPTVVTEQVPSAAPDQSEKSAPDVVRRSTRLSNREISRMSRMVGVDWDSLAGLMDIPYNEREEIRFNASHYPDSYSKAGKILELFNRSEYFCRHVLEKYFEELGRNDLKKEITFVESEETTLPSPNDVPSSENVQLRNTPLSSRETYRLSRRIAVHWDSLAGLMDIAQEERDNLRNNAMYKDDRSKAEKILSIFNVRQDFSREKLVDCLQGVKKLEWIEPIMTGAWRSL